MSAETPILGNPKLSAHSDAFDAWIPHVAIVAWLFAGGKHRALTLIGFHHNQYIDTKFVDSDTNEELEAENVRNERSQRDLSFSHDLQPKHDALYPTTGASGRNSCIQTQVQHQPFSIAELGTCQRYSAFEMRLGPHFEQANKNKAK